MSSRNENTLNVPSRLVVTGEPPYPNGKVFSLDRILSRAANDLVVMSDSDVRDDRFAPTVRPNFKTSILESRRALTGLFRAPAFGHAWKQLA